jgi:Domain of Unknown Function (DUF1080)
MPRSAIFTLFLLVTLPLFAAEKNPTYITTDQAAKDPDFAIQGEYAGDIKNEKRGVQIIALGNGKFHAVGYENGLPGDGFEPDNEKWEGDGTLKDGVLHLESEHGVGDVKDGVLTVNNAAGEKIGELKKVTRQSPTLGAKPPEGAKILFDGKTNDFKPGKTDGDLLVQGQNSQTKFQSATLHVEFLLPFKPLARGQERGNSGVYLQGRYEVQVLDSFGLRGENNECGGIYTIAKPRLNMCYPPLEWQTYDIDYTAATYDNGKKTHNATITVKQNGVLIHENVEIPHATTAAPVKEGPEPGPLHLQDHGNPVRYRNIWIVEKK